MLQEIPIRDRRVCLSAGWSILVCVIDTLYFAPHRWQEVVRALPGRDIIVIGASAGGVEALKHLVHHLPPNLPAAIFVVLHVPAHSSSVLPAILSRSGALPARHPRHNDEIKHGLIYIAPPDHHMLIQEDRVHVTRGPRENGHRPAADPLFRSAARFYGSRVTGVILSGTLDDGVAGMQAVKMHQGTTIVQDPDEALFSGMPQNALENVQIDHVLSLSEIASALARLAHEPIAAGDVAAVSQQESAEPPSADDDLLRTEDQIDEFDMTAIETPRHGTPTGFTCPDCHGALWELQDGELVRFRCRVGHAFSFETLMARQSESLEAALWIALRTLEESAAMAGRLKMRADDRGHNLAAMRFREQERDAKYRAEIIRNSLLEGQIAARDSSKAPEAAAPSKPSPTEEA